LIRLKSFLISLFLISQICSVAWGQDSLNVTMLSEVHHFVQQSYDVIMFGNHALMTSGAASGLRVLDLSDPSSPAEVGYIVNSDTCTGIEIWAADRVTRSGNFAYVLYYNGAITKAHYRLYVYEISDPASPQQMGYITLPDNCTSLFVEGNYVYVTSNDEDGFSGVKIIDVSNPAQPVEAGSFSTGGIPEEIYVTDHKAYVAVKSALVVYDVSVPSSPQFLGSYTPPGGIGLIHHVMVQGIYIYVIDAAYGIRILDASNVSQIQQVGSFPHNQNDANFSRLVLSNNLIYYLQNGSYSGKVIIILNVFNPASPLQIGSYRMPDSWRFHGFDYSNGYACIAAGFSGLRIIDVSDPGSITECGAYEPHNLATGLAISGNHAYVSVISDTNNLIIYDISDPSSPVEVNTLSIDGRPKWISASENYLYVPGLEKNLVPGVRVFDISNPATPLAVADWMLPPGTFGVPLSVERFQNLAFVATAYGGVQIYDVTQINSPVALGNWTLWDPISNPGFGVRNVKVSWPYLFLPDEAYGLYVLEASDPNNLVEVASYYTSGNAWWVDISPEHNFLYLADFGGVLRIFDVSDPLTPVEVGSIAQNLNHVNHVVAIEDTIHITDCQGIGLHVYNVSDPSSPEEIAYHRTAGVFANDIVLANSMIYFLDYTHFEIFEITEEPNDVEEAQPASSGPYNFYLSQNYPNPFNPTTKISYQIPERSFVTIKVYDVLGNEIVTLVNEEKPAGAYEIEFGATGRSGNVNNLPTGIYLYQLRAVNPESNLSTGQAGSGQGFVDAKKMTILK